ncbi:MAG: sigma-70 family RNA polymerase sigma factor [Clostridia bacterium]|nr:sigma-70 family RNA polymerase sigma factor [Clostridia bacterium]
MYTKGGELVDIETLYRQYFSTVYKYILSVSRDSHTAEEITAQTFFKAMEKIDSFKGETGVSAWLCRIAKNTYLDYVKKQSRQSEFPEELEDSAKSLEERLLESSRAKTVHKILHSLKEPYKEVFSLRTFGELSFADIAELFGKTESWARVTFYRARIMIKEELDNE